MLAAGVQCHGRARRRQRPRRRGQNESKVLKIKNSCSFVNLRSTERYRVPNSSFFRPEFDGQVHFAILKSFGVRLTKKQLRRTLFPRFSPPKCCFTG